MSLAKITQETRLTLKIGGALIVILVVLFVIFKGWSFISTTFFPPPPPPAEEKFGKLAPITFPTSTNTIPALKKNTVSGSWPTFSTTIPVYKLKENLPTITALQTGRIKAASLGYTQNQQALSTTEYKWTKDSSNNTLLYNITSFNFSVDSDYLTNASLPVEDLRSKELLMNASLSFIDALGADRVDIDATKTVISYFFINNGQPSEVEDPTNASVARIYLIQNPVNTIPIYYPTAELSSLHLMLSGPKAGSVVSARYNHFSPDLGQFSTYPLKTAEEAFNDLQNGKGYIAKPTTASTVDITDVSLGYYLSEDPNQKYLMPIIVFTGVNNFQAYTNALR